MKLCGQISLIARDAFDYPIRVHDSFIRFREITFDKKSSFISALRIYVSFPEINVYSVKLLSNPIILVDFYQTVSYKK